MGSCNVTCHATCQVPQCASNSCAIQSFEMSQEGKTGKIIHVYLILSKLLKKI
jgi:hypothetical protein